ncbi:metallophosphatase domain-containing protein [Corallococcus exiguus]|uniref:metallophosphatase domain-containing protein n=1 Tax=Corallococcus exiguus TaxID=83462 RepID=UPI001A9014F3|nr:metallophosphatase domain-containing protein [Corallococcus exiguus]MBN8468857.1 metallophosphatase domain-containing protein [Corallococcus exiguus]
MRIVAVADTHLFHRELVMPPGDIFVHAGDMCRAGDLEELARAASWIRSLPYRHKVIVAGNHDCSFADSPAEARALLGEDILYLQDSEATVAGLRFWGSPWQPAYNDWAFNLPRGTALASKWAAIPEGLDVLITHGPPAGFGDGSSVGGRSGCADLRARVLAVRPRLHLFGHIHEDGGLWREGDTCFANVTTWECERAPTVLQLDTRGVTEVSIPPARR